MPPIYLFEDRAFERFYPLTFSRSLFALRCGALTLFERTQRQLAQPIAGVLVREGLTDITRRHVTAPVNPPVSTKDGVILINARWLMLQPPEPGVLTTPDTAGLISHTLVWMHLSPAKAAQVDFARILDPHTLEELLPTLQRQTTPVPLLEYPWDLLTHQRAALAADFAALGPAQLGTLLIPGSVYQISPENIHIAPGVKLYPGVILDASHGPIILDANAEIRAHAVLTGPLYIGQNALVRTAADIREETTLGPGCRVGGEVIASIFQANANKQHHGFVGQSLIGEWANLGAGTTTSNLKNTYGTIRIPLNGEEVSTGRQFLGSLIGDHAKLGIGTYLSTGSVIGFASHVTIPRPPRFVPSFAWLTKENNIVRADFEKIEALAKTVMGRRHIDFTPADHDLFIRIAGDWAQRERFDWP